MFYDITLTFMIIIIHANYMSEIISLFCPWNEKGNSLEAQAAWSFEAFPLRPKGKSPIWEEINLQKVGWFSLRFQEEGFCCYQETYDFHRPRYHYYRYNLYRY